MEEEEEQELRGGGSGGEKAEEKRVGVEGEEKCVQHMRTVVGESLPPRVVGERSGTASVKLALVLPRGGGGDDAGEEEETEKERYCVVRLPWWGEHEDASVQFTYVFHTLFFMFLLHIATQKKEEDTRTCVSPCFRTIRRTREFVYMYVCMCVCTHVQIERSLGDVYIC